MSANRQVRKSPEDKLYVLIEAALRVANSCAFVAGSLPIKQRPAIEAIADELYAAVTEARS